MAKKDEQLEQLEQWENSIDGIYDNLSNSLAVGRDLEHNIVMVVKKLPQKVRSFVYNKCAFTSANGGGHTLCQKTLRRSWLIILDDKADKDIVAHEIAHAWLGHKLDFPDARATTEWGYKTEKEACEQATAWGFKSELEPELIEAYEEVLKQRRAMGKKYILTTEHAVCTHGKPVLVDTETNEAYGVGDILPDGTPARIMYKKLAHPDIYEELINPDE